MENNMNDDLKKENIVSINNDKILNDIYLMQHNPYAVVDGLIKYYSKTRKYYEYNLSQFKKVSVYYWYSQNNYWKICTDLLIEKYFKSDLGEYMDFLVNYVIIALTNVSNLTHKYSFNGVSFHVDLLNHLLNMLFTIKTSLSYDTNLNKIAKLYMAAITDNDFNEKINSKNVLPLGENQLIDFENYNKKGHFLMRERTSDDIVDYTVDMTCINSGGDVYMNNFMIQIFGKNNSMHLRKMLGSCLLNDVENSCINVFYKFDIIGDMIKKNMKQILRSFYKKTNDYYDIILLNNNVNSRIKYLIYDNTNNPVEVQYNNIKYYIGKEGRKCIPYTKSRLFIKTNYPLDKLNSNINIIKPELNKEILDIFIKNRHQFDGGPFFNWIIKGLWYYLKDNRLSVCENYKW